MARLVLSFGGRLLMAYFRLIVHHDSAKVERV